MLVQASNRYLVAVLNTFDRLLLLYQAVNGGIQDFTDGNDRLEVASEYFQSGADKVSVGNDAVCAERSTLKPKVYLKDPSDVDFESVRVSKPGGPDWRILRRRGQR